MLAHSPRPPHGAQTYRDHSCNVARNASDSARRACEFHAGDAGPFIDDVAAAAAYHDLGKLDARNQEVLSKVSRQPLPVAHDDAGTAHLLDSGHNEAAVLVVAHHQGLFDERKERTKERPLRNTDIAAYVDLHLRDYAKLHALAGCPVVDRVAVRPLHRSGWERRLALSCLVDADHGDTARHYGNEPEPHWPDPRWAERLNALDKYVAKLAHGSPRDESRARVYQACRDADMAPAMRACDAPVGTGKTTAVMAHLLRVATARGLRHIFVVLPYVNIVRQSVKTYRDAMTLPGEDPTAVVAEHDHQADFDSPDTRQLASLWRAPIIVTTAVQFFETIGSHHPARIRKLHELPGSAVFVDEAHAALPAHLWPQMWRWIEEWVTDWRGHIVFASGTLARFWRIPEFTALAKTMPSAVDNLIPNVLSAELEAGEGRRVTLRRHEPAFTLDALIEFVLSKPGPRIVVLNTVQSAATVAQRLSLAKRDNVLHLSTALTPRDRLRMLERVEGRLESSSSADWTLVATSCVEAGLDFSFRTGFRETATTASLVQIGGRVNRESADGHAEVWDVRLNDPLLPNNPGLQVPQRVLTSLFADGSVASLPPRKLALEALRREITEGSSKRAALLVSAEEDRQYPEVAKLCRVIDADTRFVVIDQILAQALRDGARVSVRDLLQGSVQIWAQKLNKMPVEAIGGGRSDPHGLYIWIGNYEPDFLGYMVNQIGAVDQCYIA